MAKKKGSRGVRVPPAEKAIQLKIALKYIRPPIWRRFIVPDNFTLGQLHNVIQVTMGWYNCHLHMFTCDGVCYTSEQGAEEMDMENENAAILNQIIERPKQKLEYEYDFGDSWIHQIIVEKIFPIDPQAKYPVCLDGARACPPEDCGSFPGYCDILEALRASNKTEEQQEQLEWLGDGYDPEQFDLKEANRRLAGR